MLVCSFRVFARWFVRWLVVSVCVCLFVGSCVRLVVCLRVCVCGVFDRVFVCCFIVSLIGVRLFFC